MPSDNAATIELNGRMLRAAGDAVTMIDVKYQQASFDEKLDMRDERDRAFHAYSLARNRLLMPGLVIDESDIALIEQFKTEVTQAANLASILVAAAKVASLLARIALA
jgi:hypothetical protein